jgi:hypothetical protein
MLTTKPDSAVGAQKPGNGFEHREDDAYFSLGIGTAIEGWVITGPAIMIRLSSAPLSASYIRNGSVVECGEN